MKLSHITIRTRITGGSLLIAILISVVAGILIYSQVQRIVNDGQLEVLSNIEAPYLTALANTTTEEVDPPGPDQLVAAVDPHGATRLNTLPSGLSSMLDTLVESGVRTSTISTHGGSYLVKVTQVASQGGSWHVITAINNDAQVSVLNQVALLLIASIAGINLAFGAASWLIGSAALSPVARLRRSAAELVSRPGRELLPVGPAQDEIAELASTLNELIGQLRTSAERERQVVSDASHEFRTPLAIMRTQLELAQAEASSIEQMRADVTAVQVTLARLITLATSLLELSRIDAQATPGTAGVDQLAVELANAADRGRQRVGGRDIRVEYVPLVSADDKRQVAVAAPDFGRVCDNLVSNSLTALGQAGVIELVLDSSDDGLVLSISDDAGGMDPAFVDHAFDRFSRPDSARTGSGAGLGLAIVDGIATVAGGTVRLVNRPGEGLTVITTFPFAAPQHGSDP
ncbi:MAG: hypothetical protein JWP05_2159 [Microbacteriaceae bacterium]|nr:hypothetical protein [Microbacteriaceae bacterium]